MLTWREGGLGFGVLYNLGEVIADRTRRFSRRHAKYAESDQDQRETIITVPTAETVIYKDDILMLAGSDADLTALPQE